ncbi:hypothetical protein M8J77_002937 [Diaphorina citri]|nr:hypothetical protein M8J77_002937 [Diaphorina citri]
MTGCRIPAISDVGTEDVSLERDPLFDDIYVLRDDRAEDANLMGSYAPDKVSTNKANVIVKVNKSFVLSGWIGQGIKFSKKMESQLLGSGSSQMLSPTIIWYLLVLLLGQRGLLKPSKRMIW